jgi:enterochelin esterase family protein
MTAVIAPPPGQGGAGRGPAGAPGGAGAGGRALQPYEGSYPQSLVKEIVPFIERNYRVTAEKNSRAIAGLSMGAGHTIAATNNNPGVFGYIGVFSGGGRIDETFDKQLAALKASGVKYYWLGAGDTDMAHAYHEMKGIHYWFIWRQFLSDFAPILFQ